MAVGGAQSFLIWYWRKRLVVCVLLIVSEVVHVSNFFDIFHGS